MNRYVWATCLLTLLHSVLHLSPASAEVQPQGLSATQRSCIEEAGRQFIETPAVQDAHTQMRQKCGPLDQGKCINCYIGEQQGSEAFQEPMYQVISTCCGDPSEPDYISCFNSGIGVIRTLDLDTFLNQVCRQADPGEHNN